MTHCDTLGLYICLGKHLWKISLYPDERIFFPPACESDLNADLT